MVLIIMKYGYDIEKLIQHKKQTLKNEHTENKSDI